MDASDLIAALTGAVQADLPPGTKLATVDPAYTVGGSYPTSVALPKVTFDGETTLSTKRYPVVNGVLPIAGQRVLMVPVGRTYVIIGPVLADAPILNRFVSARSGTGANIGLITPPGCKVRLSSAYSLVTGAATNFPWSSSTSTKDYESGGSWHNGGGANPERLTVPTGMDGFYDVHWSVFFAAGDGTIRIASLFKSGTQISQGEPQFNVNGLFGTQIHGTAAMVQANAGDYFTVNYFHNASGTLAAGTGYANTYLSVVLRALAP